MGVMRMDRLATAWMMATLAAGSLCGQEKALEKPTKAVRLGKLWDGKGKVWSNAIVIVRDGKILTVTTDPSTIPVGAEVIDLSRFSGLPGLIDAHTHMTMYVDETPN